MLCTMTWSLSSTTGASGRFGYCCWASRTPAAPATIPQTATMNSLRMVPPIGRPTSDRERAFYISFHSPPDSSARRVPWSVSWIFSVPDSFEQASNHSTMYLGGSTTLAV